MDWTPVGGRPSCAPVLAWAPLRICRLLRLPLRGLRCECGRDPALWPCPASGETGWRLDSCSDLWVFRWRDCGEGPALGEGHAALL